VLAGVLPGLREIRAPLAAGYLWFLFGWLVVGDDVGAAGGVLGRLVDLGGNLAPGAVAVAASFAAYLVGSMSNDLFGRALLSYTLRWVSWTVVRRQWERARESDMSDSMIESQVARFDNRANRLAAERDLRVAILPPLTAILIYFIVADNWWWTALALLVLPALYAQSILRVREYVIVSESLYQLRQRVGLPPASSREASARESGESGE
jgi:hypothetical protein